MALLSVEGLSLTIRGASILQDVGFSLAAGETLGVVGESGSGKSLTALAVMGLLPAGSRTAGRILLEGRDLLATPETAMNRLRGAAMGMVFQEPMTALNPLHTIGRQVAEVFRVHEGLDAQEAARRAGSVLARVGLPASVAPPGRYPHELSGGQRQRVVIAMAVALRPRLLIADEPTTALDVTTQAQVLMLLKDLVAEDRAGLILISHDLAVVGAMADRIAVMRQGRILEQGRAAGFFERASHPYSRALLEASRHRPRRRAQAAAAEGPPLLEVRDLVRDYRLARPRPFAPAPRLRAVDGVSLAVGAGESVGLVGESGCGKSTLGRAVLALEAADGGSIRIDGQPLAGLSGAALTAMRRKVQIVFQDPYGSFDPRHKAGRIVAEPLHLLSPVPQGEERRRLVEGVLADVGLSPADADKYPHEFSGGQRQRLAIARALITRPRLVVLDEPVSALDVSVRAQILDLLSGLQARHGLAYLFISHDLEVVRAVTDRVLVMQAGRIVEEGPTAQVLDRPRHPYTRQLVDSALHLERLIAARSAAPGPA
ncbi:MAG: dipeptide ABC transporter ATP-binding protein [Alsobacter sp.]